MAEFASKGVAGTGLGLGIAGTVGLVSQMTNGNGLGGLFGGNQPNAISTLQAENAMLKSENYADKVGKEVYMARNAELTKFKEGAFADVAREVASNRERVAVLAAKVECNTEKALLREKLIEAKIDNVADKCACGINALNQAVGCIEHKLCNITQTIVPASAICPQPMAQYNSWVAPQTPVDVRVTGNVGSHTNTCE